MMGIGVPGMILIGSVVLLLFGSRKLPELGRAAGRTLYEFKQGTRQLTGELEAEAIDLKDVLSDKPQSGSRKQAE